MGSVHGGGRFRSGYGGVRVDDNRMNGTSGGNAESGDESWDDNEYSDDDDYDYDDNNSENYNDYFQF